jgi:CheY-like chemotaxis protein
MTLERRRVAVVEDHPDGRALVEALLSGRYDVVAYANGPDAVYGCHAFPPDLVLLDLSLPGMSGHDVLAALRADPGLANVPIVAFTAEAGPDVRERLLAEGFDDHLPKPLVRIDDLRELVDRWLGVTSR